MKFQKLVSLLEGNLLTDHNVDDREIAGAMGADLMSDVLASIEPEAVLLTGLCNPQVVRTAQIADIQTIVFVRGKNPDKETIKIANQENIPLVSTDKGLFEACGILFNAGLPSFETTTTDDCSD